jgi:hypothetical protein
MLQINQINQINQKKKLNIQLSTLIKKIKKRDIEINGD